jgi:GT2 family glycosyltransferase
LKQSLPDTEYALAVVIIGRNEGERLRKSIVSSLHDNHHIVYVDSGSTDGSVELAKSLDVDVVELDNSTPFTAARGRNTGFKYLREKESTFLFVQFVDGDDEMDEEWFRSGVITLLESPAVGIVAGRKKECFPDKSIYNTLFELDWDTAIGEVNAVSGTCMVRADVFEQVGGFNETLIAGEDPDLCVRVRQAGWKVLRLANFMGWHDANMMHFIEWWKRTVRTGHAYAEGAQMHGKSFQRYNVRECRSNWVWGLILPIIMVGLVVPTHGLSLLMLLGYVLLLYRVFKWRKSLGNSNRNAIIYAGFTVIGKLPCALGQILYWKNRWQGKVSSLIEYKAS